MDTFACKKIIQKHCGWKNADTFKILSAESGYGFKSQWFLTFVYKVTLDSLKGSMWIKLFSILQQTFTNSVRSALIGLLLDEFSHRVVPFLADFHKDVVKLVDLLDGLAGLTVERDQDKVLDCCRVEREKEKQEEKETKEKNEGRRFSLNLKLIWRKAVKMFFYALTCILALEANHKRLSDKRLLAPVLVLTRHVHRLHPVWGRKD